MKWPTGMLLMACTVAMACCGTPPDRVTVTEVPASSSQGLPETHHENVQNWVDALIPKAVIHMDHPRLKKGESLLSVCVYEYGGEYEASCCEVATDGARVWYAKGPSLQAVRQAVEKRFGPLTSDP